MFWRGRRNRKREEHNHCKNQYRDDHADQTEPGTHTDYQDHDNHQDHAIFTDDQTDDNPTANEATAADEQSYEHSSEHDTQLTDQDHADYFADHADYADHATCRNEHHPHDTDNTDSADHINPDIQTIHQQHYNNLYDNPYNLQPLSRLEQSPFTLPIISTITLLIRLLSWVIRDIYRSIRFGRKNHLYGVWCFVGLPGAGKTMSLVKYLDDQRRIYGEGIIIVTNFSYAGQDGHLGDWKQVLKEYDRPIIFAWDELQNEFNSREYRKFPVPLVHELTQNRKGHGKQVVYTTQTFTAVDKNFRALTSKVIDCRTYLNRLTSTRYYKREFFEARQATSSIFQKQKIKPAKRMRFIQTDYIRSRYDSFQRLDYLKTLDYNGLSQGNNNSNNDNDSDFDD